MSYVYFIRPIGMDGPVKIGRSIKPVSRLRELMVWSAFELEVAATTPGASRLELQFHTMFASDHSHHEWFKPSPGLTRTIEQLQAGSFDFDGLPEPRRVTGPANGNGWNARTLVAVSLTHRINSLKRRYDRLGLEMPPEDFGWRWGKATDEEFEHQAEMIRAYLDRAREAIEPKAA